jgi:hypothetical protein
MSCDSAPRKSSRDAKKKTVSSTDDTDQDGVFIFIRVIRVIRGLVLRPRVGIRPTDGRAIPERRDG